MTVEIFIPIRNPTEVLAKTVDSLIAQTDKNFSVLISDNFSTKGQEYIEHAVEQLKAAGIEAQKIRPPMELERIEHPNWVQYQSKAEWLKPLYVGDWLEPVYISRLREVVASNALCRYVFSNGYVHWGDTTPSTGVNRWAGHFNPPQVMQDVVLRFGMQFGPPTAAAYERATFYALGGFPTELPIAADSFFYCMMSARFGVAGIQERLFHFNIHNARFSTTLASKRRDAFREAMIYFFMLAYHAWTERDRFPVAGFLRMLARETRNYFFRN
jgi:glycosyltransferase involved in cell wall biosynthesis